MVNPSSPFLHGSLSIDSLLKIFQSSSRGNEAIKDCSEATIWVVLAPVGKAEIKADTILLSIIRFRFPMDFSTRSWGSPVFLLTDARFAFLNDGTTSPVTSILRTLPDTRTNLDVTLSLVGSDDGFITHCLMMLTFMSGTAR